MKQPCAWAWAAVLGFVGVAWAQPSPPVVVCPTGDPDACIAVDFDTIPVLSTDTPGSWVDEPPEIGWAWETSHPDPDPSLLLPGTCARTADRARARFAEAMAGTDLNRLLATYQWRGQSDGDVDGLIDRIAAVDPQGHWERSFPAQTPGFPTNAPLTHWRWQSGSQAWHFDLLPVNGCWFVAFAAAPQAWRPTPAGKVPSREPRRDLEHPDELVF